MCGILFAPKSVTNKDRFKSSLDLMQHRGPDAPGCITEISNYYLGHNRLSIIDLNPRSNQPFISTDKRFSLIFNGEIYNYKELAQKHQVPMRTSSDTEVLIELYSRMGSRCLDELNGIFAFIIVENSTGQIFVARDRLGVKPLYYYQKGNEYIFSSEINAIISLTNDTKIDPIGFRQYKKLRTFFNGRTLYDNIKMFPAGSYLESNSIHKYWELNIIPQAPPEDDELRDLIQSSVNYRLVADVPIGSYLSGGLDSTIVTALSRTQHSWTVGTSNNNEFEFGRIAAQRYNTIHHEVLYAREEFIEAAKLMIKKRKEPLSVPNEVLLYLMTKEVKKHNTVVLSGEGADELFFGYDRIFRWAHSVKHFDIDSFDKFYSYGSYKDNEILDDALSPFSRYNNAIDIVAAFFQIAHLHGLLRRLDNSTMLCAVEAREPFVDYRLIERMAGVPFEYRMAGGNVKEPLKRVFKDQLPSEIIERKKVGFPVILEEIIPKSVPGNSGMDRWFNFNLLELGIQV
ncbi:MAG: asparagine synthase (glutamine-hydrolyzing) [Bacteroidetes bacterium]|nr:asparagine synthase (glutamine-hydrolyzing) [Bacteroidota bacterium]